MHYYWIKEYFSIKVCENHVEYIRLTNRAFDTIKGEWRRKNIDKFKELLWGIPSIWFLNGIVYCHIGGYFNEVYILLLNKTTAVYYSLEYSEPVLHHIIMYKSDIIAGWYVKNIEKKVDDEVVDFHSIFYPYTYECKLYKMRTPELYFGAIPLDILDEVIKYL